MSTSERNAKIAVDFLHGLATDRSASAFHSVVSCLPNQKERLPGTSLSSFLHLLLCSIDVCIALNNFCDKEKFVYGVGPKSFGMPERGFEEHFNRPSTFPRAFLPLSSCALFLN